MKKKALEEVLETNLTFLDNKINVKMDSKLIEKNDVFIAIKGGNNYIEEAINRGASLIICENKEYKNYKNVILVNDSIKLMQNWAKTYLKKINVLKIAITGSNGKTSTKDIVYTLLSNYKIGIKTLGNYNNHIGLPFTALQVEEDDDFAVFEMGMSKLGEIDLLANIVKPDISLITNIGDSHLEYLGSREGVFKAKTELIKHTKGKLVLNGDDEFLKNLDGIKVGFGLENKYKIIFEGIHGEFTKFSLNNLKNLETNLLGKHNLYNLAMALALLEEISYEINEGTIELMKNMILTKMRFEKIFLQNKIFINDAYNASPISMKYALETFNEIYNDRIKVLVLGDMLELGKDSESLHKSIAKNIEGINFDYIYLTGSEMKYLFDEIKGKEKVFYSQNKDWIKKEILKIDKPCAVLLKASRGLKLEDIIL